MNALTSRYCNKGLLYPELQEIAASLASVGILSIVPPSTKVMKSGRIHGSLIRSSSSTFKQMMCVMPSKMMTLLRKN